MKPGLVILWLSSGAEAPVWPEKAVAAAAVALSFDEVGARWEEPAVNRSRSMRTCLVHSTGGQSAVG